MIAVAFAAVFAVLLYIALRYSTVGVAGLTTQRDENPAAFWITVATFAFCLVVCASIASGLF